MRGAPRAGLSGATPAILVPVQPWSVEGMSRRWPAPAGTLRRGGIGGRAEAPAQCVFEEAAGPADGDGGRDVCGGDGAGRSCLQYARTVSFIARGRQKRR